jgi:hypothetical protein
MLIDLCVHVGAHGLPLDAVLARVVELGLDGVVVAADGAVPDVKARRGKDGQPALFAGVLTETDRGRYLAVLPNPEPLPPLTEIFGPRTETPWTVRDVLARTTALGGAIVALSPYDATIPHPGGDILYTLSHLSAVQTVGASTSAGISAPAIEAAECLGLPCVGASGARSLDQVGRAATLFAHPIRNEIELIAALRAGACWPVEFGEPPADLMHRGKSAAPRPAPAPGAATATEGDRPRRRRRR